MALQTKADGEGRKARSKKVPTESTVVAKLPKKKYEEPKSPFQTYCPLLRPWTLDSTSLICLTGTCDPQNLCICRETSPSSFQSQSYPHINYIGTETFPHSPHASERRKSLDYDTSHNVTDQVQAFSSPAITSSIATAEGYDSLGYPGTRPAGTSSYLGIGPSRFDETPLQRFEAEPVDDQPYNTVSFFRTMLQGSNLISQNQPSLNVAYNGSDNDFCAEDVDSFGA